MVCSSSIRIVSLLDGRVEGVHVDVDDLALTGRGLPLVVVLVGHVVCPDGSSSSPSTVLTLRECTTNPSHAL
jgi:hypothetical protein